MGMTSLAQFLIQLGFPVQYIWVIPIALIVIGIVFTFFSGTAWQVSIALTGAGAGFALAAKFLVPIALNNGITPVWWIYLFTASIFAVLLYRWVKAGVVLGIAGLVYYLMVTQTFYILPAISVVGFGLPMGALAVAAFAGAAAYFLYSKISIIIGATLGGISIYYGLLSMINPLYAAGVAALFLTIGLYRQVRKKPRVKKIVVKEGDKK